MNLDLTSLLTPEGRKLLESKAGAAGKALDMNAYTDALPAPKGAQVNAAAAQRGAVRFARDCSSCHNGPGEHVSVELVSMTTIFPGYAPGIIAERKAPLSPVQDSPGTFDDKMIVIDASERGEKRGVAVPLLLDLARTTIFLHDASVPTLDALLDPKRGATMPHPFYIDDPSERADMVEFLRGLETP